LFRLEAEFPESPFVTEEISAGIFEEFWGAAMIGRIMRDASPIVPIIAISIAKYNNIRIKKMLRCYGVLLFTQCCREAFSRMAVCVQCCCSRFGCT